MRSPESERGDSRGTLVRSALDPARCTTRRTPLSTSTLTSDKYLVDIFSNDKYSSFIIRSSSIHGKASALSAPGHGHERGQKAIVAMSTSVLIQSNAEVFLCRQPNICYGFSGFSVTCESSALFGLRVSIFELY